MIVTIDGPAGAGKSSVARCLARELGFDFLDTGAMYRCVTLACLQRGVSLQDFENVANTARKLSIEFQNHRTFMDGQDVSEEIRKPSVTQAIRPIADNISVREAMVAAQRAWTSNRNVVTEGRDQGTVAFPNAECKIFLTATSEERARRRVAQLIDLGMDADYHDILAQQNLRDEHDMSRPSGGLRPAEDALTVCTDDLTEAQVLQILVDIVRNAVRNAHKHSTEAPSK